MIFRAITGRDALIRYISDGVHTWNLHTNFRTEAIQSLRLFIDPRDNLSRVHAHIRRSTQGVNNFEVIVRLKVQYDAHSGPREMFISRCIPIVKSQTPSRREARSEFLTNIATLATLHIAPDSKVTVHTG